MDRRDTRDRSRLLIDDCRLGGPGRAPARRSGDTPRLHYWTSTGSGTENTTFASGWPTCHPTVKSGRDWSIGSTKCITNVSGAGAAETKASIASRQDRYRLVLLQ